MGFLDKYQTYRRVNVQGGVGKLYYLMLLLVILVIIMQMCGINKSHLYQETNLHGTVWARLQQPRSTKLKCTDDLGNATCEFWDWLEAVDSGPQGIFIATYVQDKLQRRICPRLNTTCGQQLWADVTETDFYLASPENFEMLIEHRVHKHIHGKLFEMDSVKNEGLLLPHDYPELHFTPTGLIYDPNRTIRVFSTGVRDGIPIHELLTAAGIKLTDPVCLDCGDPTIQGLGRSLRKWGVHLEMTFLYSNMWSNLCPWFATGPSKYAYRLHYVPAPEGVRTIRTIPSSIHLNDEEEGETRVVRRTFGIRITYHQTGLIGLFDSVSLLAFIIGCITLLGVPWTISELYVTLAPFICAPKWYGAVVVDESEVEKKDK